MKHFRRLETANIRIPNKRGRTIQVVEEDQNGKRRRWVDKDRKEMLSKITDTSLDELTELYNAEGDFGWNEWFEKNGLKDAGYDKTGDLSRDDAQGGECDHIATCTECGM